MVTLCVTMSSVGTKPRSAALLFVIVGVEWARRGAGWDDSAMTSDLLERHTKLNHFLDKVKAHKEIRTSPVVNN